MAAGETAVRLSQTSPAFLHANSTSHTWPFSAIAELIDNAYDPDVAASQLFIDVEEKSGEKLLVFMDNGNGLTQPKLHKMLSFGYCDKVEVGGHKPVGHYGNGFKSGSMRLGKDAIVFTKTSATQSVGLLSQTYLSNIGATTVLVPMVTWSRENSQIIVDESSKDSLEAIITNSIFKSEKELKNEFSELDMFDSGTRIIIYNLKRLTDGKLELDLESNSNDIRNPETHELDFSTTLRPVVEHVPEYWKSLRDYCSILFLKPRMKIILRGHKVKTKLISKSLSRTEKDFYKPVYLPKPVKIIFGFADSVEDYGLMLYHRNRLIKAFERVGCQKQANDHGVGIVGVIEVDFLEPVHNKQDFNKTDRYNATVNSLGQKLNDYWYTKTQSGSSSVTDERRKADWTWVQCENCLRWRRLPDGFTDEGLPDKWYCYMNADPVHNRCDIDEEPEDEDELQAKASYNKVKKKVEPRKSGEMMQREMAIAEKEKELITMQQSIQQSLEPLAPPGSRGRQPTVADLEAAQKQLEMAKRREKHQREVIESLQRSRKQIAVGQNQMRRNMMSQNSNNMNVLNNIAKSGQPREQVMQNGKKRKERIALPDGDVIVTRNASSSSDEASENAKPSHKKNKLLVKFPKKRKRMLDPAVIVIDSDDDNDDKQESNDPNAMDTPDVKPDVNELDQQMTNGDITNGEITKDKTVKEKSKKAPNVEAKSPKGTGDKVQKKVTAATSKDTATDVLNSSKFKKSALKDNRVHKHTQTTAVEVKDADGASTQATAKDPADKPSTSYDKDGDNKKNIALLQDQLEETKSKLTGLRNNVGKLLQTILPDLQVDNLQYIDAIVSEMVRVNGDDEAPNGEAPNGQLPVNNAAPPQQKDVKKETES